MVGPNTQTSYRASLGPLCIAGILRQRDCTAEEHEHPEAQLTILFEGNAANLVTHDESGKTRRTGIVPESFVFVAPGQPHRVNWRNDGELLHLWIPKDVLIELSEEMKCPVPPSRLGDRPDPAIYGIGRILMNEFETTGCLSHSMINHASSLMVSRVLRQVEQPSDQTASGLLSLQRLQPAINFVNDCPERNFTLLELAGLCHSSVFHFARSFTARLGCAPFAFQRSLRLKKAQQLLRTTELPVELVGAAVGFENATHFSRVFRRYAGQSPREYRQFNRSKK